jgi:membrane-associated phospholipid phosphatase
MENLVDGIGFYGPKLLVMIDVFFLSDQLLYLFAYLIFRVVNSIVNKYLKLFFREHRPKNQIHYTIFDKPSFRGETSHYGMPSGHAQHSFYSISFLYLATNSKFALFLSIFIAACSGYQRWKYNKHSLTQLLVGTMIGIIMGYVAYYTVEKYMNEENMNIYFNLFSEKQGIDSSSQNTESAVFIVGCFSLLFAVLIAVTIFNMNLVQLL